MPLPKGHPQREANRAYNERRRKKKEDEAEKKRKHEACEAWRDAGEDINTSRRTMMKTLRSSIISSLFSLIWEKSLAFSIRSFFIGR